MIHISTVRGICPFAESLLSSAPLLFAPSDCYPLLTPNPTWQREHCSQSRAHQRYQVSEPELANWGVEATSQFKSLTKYILAFTINYFQVFYAHLKGHSRFAHSCQPICSCSISLHYFFHVASKILLLVSLKHKGRASSPFGQHCPYPASLRLPSQTSLTDLYDQIPV